MKIKKYIPFLFVALISTIASVGATTIITANNITYSNKNTNADTVELALNELFDSVSLTERIEALEAKNNALENKINNIYPVGTIYTSIKNTNPSTLFGGTWVEYGKGQTLVGVDTSQTEFATVEKTGGEKNHTLTVAEMPSHSHIMNVYHVSTGSYNATPAKLLYKDNTTTAWVSEGGSGCMTNTGGSQAHNNLQPYITVYMWKRIA